MPSAPRPFPDYARTDHPEVIQAIRTINEQYASFLTRIRDLSEKYTGARENCYINGAPLDRMNFAGFAANHVDAGTLPGRWKKPEGNKIQPYANNPVAEELKVGYKAVDIPGRGNLIWGHGRFGTGVVFEHEGFAYSHIGFTTHALNERDTLAMNEFGWTEILASEYHVALEAAEAARNEASDA